MTPQFHMPFQLSDAERISPLWQRLSERWEKRIAQLQVKLESDQTTESETAAIRGHIKALREQLALNKELLPGHEAAQ